MSDEECVALAREISADPKRRVLLLLMLWPLLKLEGGAVEMIGSLLPENHPSISWVRKGPTTPADDDLIADLGNTATCRAVLDFLNPKPEKG